MNANDECFPRSVDKRVGDVCVTKAFEEGVAQSCTAIVAARAEAALAQLWRPSVRLARCYAYSRPPS